MNTNDTEKNGKSERSIAIRISQHKETQQEEKVAERTGLEPATPCVTGRYSNQLNYRSAAVGFSPDA